MYIQDDGLTLFNIRALARDAGLTESYRPHPLFPTHPLSLEFAAEDDGAPAVILSGFGATLNLSMAMPSGFSDMVANAIAAGATEHDAIDVAMVRRELG